MNHVVSIAIDGDLMAKIEKYRASLPIAPKKSTVIRALIAKGLEAEHLKGAPPEAGT